jgi:diguanylate cyclase (GGDEF)-like protein
LVWNAGVNPTSFGCLAYLVSVIHGMVDHERDIARTDFLTGLPNTRPFSKALATELVRTRRSHAVLTVAYLDVDDFKKINDTLGHEAGDSALREIAAAVRGAVRASDIVARRGGDEFVLLLHDADADRARKVLARVLAHVASVVGGEHLQISLSVGAVTCVGGCCDGDELVRRADNLMYDVKQDGKGHARYEILTGDAVARPRPTEA